MKVKVARTAGFCGGVRRAVNVAVDAARERPGPIWSLGPLVHNPEVVGMLATLGVQVARELPAAGTVVIRAHGTTPAVRQELKARGLAAKNATCPKVSRVHAIVMKHHRRGDLVVVLGDLGHAEVDGIVAYAEGAARVISGPEEVAGLPPAERVVLVAQTTQERGRLEAAGRALCQRYGAERVTVVDTICDATSRRQAEARRLAAEVEAVVVVGGAQSANTRRLAEVVEAAGAPAFLVDGEDGLDRAALAKFKVVGLTAGASTPNWMIRRVYDALVEIGEDRTLWRRLVRGLNWLVLSNLYIALGAAALTLAAARLMGGNPLLRELAVNFLFVFAAHTLTLLANPRALAMNVPRRARSFDRHRRGWTAASAAALAAAALMGFSLGPGTGVFLLLLALVIGLYPTRLRTRGPGRPRARSLAEVPGNKDIFMAAGWSALIVAVPAATSGLDRLSLPALGTALGLVAGLVFVRALLRDFRDIQADRLIGRETIPILLGVRRTRAWIYLILAIVASSLVLFTALGAIPSPLGYALIAPLAYAALSVPLFTRQTIVSGFGAELIIDGVFLLAGAVALAAGS